MALQPSGLITLSDIQDEFGGANPIGLSEYYRGGAYTTDNNTSVPESGAISLSDFYSATNTVTVTYELIGGGGGGAGSRYAITGVSINGSAGGTTSISGDGFTTATSEGGAGGAWAIFASTPGEASDYGAGGAEGINKEYQTLEITSGSAPASTSYGAGGGGGGGAFDGRAGRGGSAATKVESSQNVAPGTELTVTIGAAGSRGRGTRYADGSGGSLYGGFGAAGYVKITVNGVSTEFTSSGTYTVPS
jgi:hypothetical protein